MDRPVLLSLLHSTNPYDGFEAESHPSDMSGWHGDHRFLAEIVEERKPEVMVEVGTWKGQSAVNFGTEIVKYGGTLVCVDTWLGSEEFWTDTSDIQRYKALGLQHGYPTVYYQFLANVCRAGLQETIVPFPQTSTTAARVLKHYGVSPNMVYIDASHDSADVLADMRAWWPMVTVGGVLFGDDYEDWAGVRHAVDVFRNVDGARLTLHGNFWVMEKVGKCGSSS